MKKASLAARMTIISESNPSLKTLKKKADSLTKEHEGLLEKASKIAHKAMKEHLLVPGKANFSDEEVKRRNYEHIDHYMQHILPNEHPELHKRIKELGIEAPKARVAYKRASKV